MRTAIIILLYTIGLLLMMVALSKLMEEPADAACGGSHHPHEGGICHAHCHNGMSLHNSTHGSPCGGSATPTPTKIRTLEIRTLPTATPTPQLGTRIIGGYYCVRDDLTGKLYRCLCANTSCRQEGS